MNEVSTGMQANPPLPPMPDNLVRLALLGLAVVVLTLATPFVFRAGGDNAYMVMAISIGLIAMAATPLAERTATTKALWLVLGIAVFLRLILLFEYPLLSDDIHRYVWDGRVQGAGINPYRYIPADPALAALRDTAIYPRINRADYAVTIYPPIAQMFFFLVTRVSDTITMMKLALLMCEAGTIGIIILLLRRMGQPVTRVVAYTWHPLPMWEIANSGHIDALMVFLMMLGLWLAISGKPLRGGVTITLAALAKPFAVAALPALWRPWDWRLPLLVIGTIALCYTPYLSVGWGVLGFLTSGYLSEEGFDSGAQMWPLAMWRQIAGMFPGDHAAYLAVAALILAITALRAAMRAQRSAQDILRDTSLLLMLLLFLLSPNLPWYYLALTPFVALIGGAPIWAFTLGAILLQQEVTIWGPFVPILIRKSILSGTILAICVYVVWQAWRAHRTKGVCSDEPTLAR